MRLVFGLVLIAGLGLAGFAVYMAQNYIGAYENALEGQEPRVTLRQIEENEVFMDLKVSEPGGDAGLTSRLKKGMRAFAVRVDVASGVSGFLRPGDRVDVYWTGRIGSRDPSLPQGDVTKLIQTGVELIAIDQTANADSTSATIARTVTVAATPQQIASLAQAQSTGALSLSLMANNDTTIAEAIEVDQRSLLGLEKKEAPSIQRAREEPRGIAPGDRLEPSRRAKGQRSSKSRSPARIDLKSTT